MARPVLLNLFSTTAHLLGITHQTTHYIYSTYFAIGLLTYDVHNIHFIHTYSF